MRSIHVGLQADIGGHSAGNRNKPAAIASSDNDCRQATFPAAAVTGMLDARPAGSDLPLPSTRMRPSTSRFLNVIVEALCDCVGADRPGEAADADPASLSHQHPHVTGDHLDPIEVRGLAACAWSARHLEEPTFQRRHVRVPGIDEPTLH